MQGIKEIQFSDALQLAQVYFNLSFPCSIGTLKKAYREACRKLHPDLGGDEEKFKQMQLAYERIEALQGKSLGIFQETEIDNNGHPTTTDGTPLSDLGKGLGPTTNGKDCPSCEHKGYSVRFGHAWKFCDYCMNGFVRREFPCNACQGTGKFTQRNTKRIVPCLRCQGSGVWKHPFLLMMCPKCFGSQTIHESDEKTRFYEKCDHCHGTGEVLIWNPVIPKGSLNS